MDVPQEPLEPPRAPVEASEGVGTAVSRCPHCGTAVEGVKDAFCCAGCEMADAIIRGAGLERYYADRDAFAPRPEPLAGGWDALPAEPGVSGLCEIRLAIDGLRCASCVWVAENVLQRTVGVDEATVSYATGRATLRWDPTRVGLGELAGRIAALGYRPRLLGEEALPDRDLLLRLGVATFAAANVMMFAAALSFAMALAGYFLPSYIVRRKIETRKQDIMDSFPDAMDMMLVCIEGGQSLDQAMARVGEEMSVSSGPLAEEFSMVSYEFRAGKDRIHVLRDFAERCAVSDISSFVTVLIQSTAFGTSVAQALRVYASEMRDKRLMRAEEKANVLPTKLTLGTMMFTVPPLILILVGPSFIMIIRSLTGLMGSGAPVP